MKKYKSSPDQLPLFDVEPVVKPKMTNHSRWDNPEPKKWAQPFANEVKNLRCGHAVVWRELTELCASGDWQHLPDKNIWHNIEILRLIIAVKRKKKGYLCNYEPEAIIEVTDVKLIRRQKEAQESSIFIWDSNLMKWELETDCRRANE